MALDNISAEALLARIPEAELTALKQSTPLAALAEARGLLLKKAGKDLIANCPFHDDKTASFLISERKNVFNCFGCGAGGSVVDFIMRIENVSFRHAVEILRTDPLATGSKTARKLDNPFSDVKGKALLSEVQSFYVDTFKESPEAQAYLDKRGLLDVAEHFGVGFSNRSLGLRLPAKNRKAGADIRMRLVEVGIYRGSGHEHLRGSVVVPFFDESGDVVEMYGRKITRPLRKGTAQHLYLAGPHRGVLNKKALGSDLVLCEAPLDAMSFYAAGIESVTTAFGAGGLTDELFALLARSSRVHIAFDGDDAGDKHAKVIADRLVTAGVCVHRVVFPRGVDANEVLSQRGADALTRFLRQSEWLGGKRAPAAPAAAEPVAQATQAAPIVDAAPVVDAVPAAQPAALDAKIVECSKRDQLTADIAGRSYRVRGLSKNTVYDVLKLNVMVTAGERYHVDTFDLYSAKARAHFAKVASKELSIAFDAATRDIGKLLRILEAKQDAHIQGLVEEKPEPEPMSAEARKEALALLEDPALLSRILDDFDAVGVVGEEANKLIGYLAAVSRKMKKPLAVMVQSSSAAGKSSLMDAVLNFVPDEDKVAYSAMTGQSLFYMEDGNLKHKVLAIAEEEGAERASYALKILQSEGKLKIASTGKDPNTGRHVTSEYEVEGPASIFSTTTAIDIDEELLNRCLALTVDEDSAQTKAIYESQRLQRTKAGYEMRQRREAVIACHQNAQRLLRPLVVINHFAPFLSFPDHQVRLRRDHAKYLGLIDAIALLHQHQRPLLKMSDGAEAIEVLPSDIDLANHLLSEILARSLDELAPQTRLFLSRLHSFVTERAKIEGCVADEVRFCRREVRSQLGLSASQCQRHLACLTEFGYVFAERQKGERTLFHSLLFRPDDERALPHGLTNGEQALAKLKNHRAKPRLAEAKPTQKPPKTQVKTTHNPTREIIAKLGVVQASAPRNSDMGPKTQLQATRKLHVVAS